jgi:fluoroquinolone resistance protein
MNVKDIKPESKEYMMPEEFDQSEYANLSFKNCIRKSAVVDRVDFDTCTFTKCSFHETTFHACKFQHCTFLDCDLSLVNFTDSSFLEVVFKKTNLIGIDWTKTSLSKKNYLKQVDFFECVLNYSTFVGISLKNTILSRCIAHDVDFSDADLTKTDCKNTDFMNSRFANTNLTEADFTGAINYLISVTNNNIKKARFSLPEALSLLSTLDIILTDNPDEE